MRSALAHIPHCGHAPVLGDLRFLHDTLAFARGVQARCGPVARGMLFARDQVLLFSAEASEQVLLDRAGNFSARGGWQPLLGRLFPGGLIVRDGVEHREHRRRMLPAFRQDALARHLARMAPRIEAAIDGWLAQGTVEFYAAAKRLTLAIALDVLVGPTPPAEAAQIDHDFSALVQASAAVLRLPFGGTRYARGLQARARLVRTLSARIPARREAPDDDLFTQLCRLQGDDGLRFSDADIVDHLIFILMAAHDTTTSALCTLVQALAEHPAWQARLRDEGAPLGDAPPTLEGLARLDGLGQALREALRLHPPLPTIARQAIADCEIHGLRIPAGTPVTVFPLLVQRDPRWWSAPDEFDPLRFAPGRAEQRAHPCAWTPFGGGAHMCLGMHFAEMQVKAVLQPLLRRARWRLVPGQDARYEHAPIARPRRGLQVRWTV